MSNARSHRRRVQRENRYGEFKVYPPGTTRREITSCQHCGASDLDLMDTYAELVEVAAFHGMQVGGFDACVPRPSGWWFCHLCAQGGAVFGV